MAAAAASSAEGTQAPASPASLAAVQRLRYEVYCLERRFLQPAAHAAGRETDAYDPHAVHLVATDHHGNVAATLRLVRDSPLGFPLERHAGRLLPGARRLPRERAAEISRLIVARAYRQDSLDHRLVLFGLFREMYEESRRLGVEVLIAAMEKPLWRLLRRFGFAFAPLGKPISYYGEVVPYYAGAVALAAGYQRILAYQRGVPPRLHAGFSHASVRAPCHDRPA